MTAPRIYYDNRFADNFVTASTTLAGTYANNVSNWRTFEYWTPTAMPATITVDSGSAATLDYWGLIGHNLHTKGCTVELRRSTDNFSASDVLVDTLTPSTDADFIRWPASTSYRYTRMRFTTGTAPTIAIALAGNKFELQGYLDPSYDPLGRTSVGQQNMNENGRALGRNVDYNEFRQTVHMRLCQWAWLRSTLIPAWNAHIRSKPFAWQWNAAQDSAPMLVVAGEKLSTPHSPGIQAEYSFDIAGVF